MTKRILLLGILLSAGSFNASATFTTLSLPTLTTDIRTWSDGGTYTPLFPSSQTLAGVPFQFNSDANGNTAFNGNTDLTIPVNILGATTVYTLINTAYGSKGAKAGSITFSFSGGSGWTVDLIVGDNVRDHYNGYYWNFTTASYVTQTVYGSPDSYKAHLDMQAFAIPTAYAGQTLAEIVFHSEGGSPGGRAFLAGATVSAVPEPSTLPAGALLLALSGAGVLRKMRNHRAG